MSQKRARGPAGQVSAATTQGTSPSGGSARVARFGRLLAALDRDVRAVFKRGAGMPYDLTWPQYMALGLLAAQGSLSQSAIAAHLGVTGPTVVRIIDALESKGLATRNRDRPDRRLISVTLTAQGARVQQEGAARYEQHLSLLLDRVPPAEQDALLSALAQLLCDSAGAHTTHVFDDIDSERQAGL